MRKPRTLLAPLLLAFVLAAMSTAAAPVPFALLHSLFDPGTNVQANAMQGQAVAVDGDIAVIGAPGDDVGAYNAGQVKVYNATSGVWLLTLTNPSPRTAFLGFGQSVAISGTRIVAGAPGNFAYVYDLTGATPTKPIATLINTGSVVDFGTSVAIAGTRVVVGSPYDNSGARRAGSAHVYDLTNAIPGMPFVTLRNPFPNADDNFGLSVAISGTWVVVGAPCDGTAATEAGIAYVYNLSSATPTLPVASLANPNPAEEENFGVSVAISGARVVIGARFEGTSELGVLAYVYDLSSATPSAPTTTLVRPIPAQINWPSVSISGTRVVVGIQGDDSLANNAGIAFVYNLSSVTLTNHPVATLTNPSPAVNDSFGFSVAISGTRVVVGTPNDNDDAGADRAGSAYLYDLAKATPTVPVATLSTPSLSAGTQFGYAITVSGTVVAIVARYDSTGGISAGTVYIYDLASVTPMIPVTVLTNPNPASSAWIGNGYAVAVSEKRVVVGGVDGTAHVYDLASATPSAPVATLTNLNSTPNGYFGSAVAISGTRVVVGAPFDDTGATDAGGAYVYDLASMTPTLPIATLVNPTPRAGDSFGHAVAISGTRVVVGTPNARSAYVYDLSSATPPLTIATLTNPSPTFSYFGQAVGISGTRVVIGAYGDSTAATAAGSAYVYDLASVTPASPSVTLTNPSPATNEWFGFSVGISGTRVVVGAPYDGTTATEAGIAYVYDLSSATPAAPLATLSSPIAAARDTFGFAVAIDDTTVVVGAPRDDSNAPDRGAAFIYGLRPVLNIVPAAPGFATISWTPATSSGFVLQYTDVLAPSTNWVTAASGAANPVNVSATNSSRFYRLRQP